MTSIEQPCYTIINAPSDSEPYNEMQLKADLGMLYCIFRNKIVNICVFRKRRCETKNRSSEENNTHYFVRRTLTWPVNDNYQVCFTFARSHDQETAFNILGDCRKQPPMENYCKK